MQLKKIAINVDKLKNAMDKTRRGGLKTVNGEGKGVKASTQVLDPEAVLAAIEGSLAMIEFDPEGKVLWANDHFAMTMGYDVAEMTHMSHKQFCTPGFVNSIKYTEFWESLRKGKSFQAKIQRVAQDGRLVWLEATYTPVLNCQGEVQAVMKVATDITEREKNMNEMALELQDMSERLGEQAEKGIIKIQEVARGTEKLVNESRQNLQVLDTMKVQADSIRDIVKSIRDIAKQTNVLALNASIESARAGVYGRGFGVVAEEVRKLSSRVQTAVDQVNANVEGMSDELVKIQRSQTNIQESQVLIQQTVEEFQEVGVASSQLQTQATTFRDIL